MINNEIILISEEDDIRVDSYIANKLSKMSRTSIKKLIVDENVTVNTKKCKPNLKLRIGDKIEISIPEVEQNTAKAQNIPLEIIFEDKAIIVINKKKGMVVHPAPGNYENTLVNALLYHFKKDLSDINGEKRPGIVHRIDKDTSGVLVIAKTNDAHRHLAELFKTHSIDREYIALVYGNIPENGGSINASIGRDPNYRKKMAVNLKNGKRAFTTFTVLKRYNGYTLIKAILETGRTHQIRVHMKYIGYPLVGDELYTNRKDKSGIKGQMLHAGFLGFSHPLSGKRVQFSSDVPEYFNNFLEGLENLE